jgi:U3 small nucleolar RNA-associated protein 6
LEQLRKLRKEKVLLEWNDKVRRRSAAETRHSSKDADTDEQQQQQQQAVYKTSGPGDSHMISHIHFLYQRTLRKFQYPLDVLLTYANFAKETKSFKVLSFIYAMGIQYHPRIVGLWIEAANFEYFGYVAQDYETTTTSTAAGSSSTNEGNESRSSIHTKIVGSSIRNARILLQRGLRINKCSGELWIQYFTLELHYVQKLHGRREILTNNKNDEEGEEEEEKGSRDGNNNDTELLPLRVIYQNAIKSIPSDIQLRLRFIETCSLFPNTQSLLDTIMTSISVDFRHSVQGWVARISYANDKWKESGSTIVECVTNNDSKGLLDKINIDDDNNNNDSEGDEELSQPKKKARVDNNDIVFANHNVLISHDPALTLLHEALMTVPTPRMYLEGARFLRMRFHLLYNSCKDDDNDNDDDRDFNYLLKTNEDVQSATNRHGTLLTELYDNAKKKNVLSTTLILDHVDWIMNADNVDSANTAECILRNAIDSLKDDTPDDARLWLQWAEIADHKSISMTYVDILRRGLKSTPLHHRRAHTLLLTELMKRLMSQHNLTSSSSKVDDELKGLFQKLILLSQGSDYSISYVKKMKCNDDTGIDEEILEDSVEVNITSTVLAYLNYMISNVTNNSDNNKGEEKKDVVRSIYTCVLYQSNYYKSCIGKSNEELHNMKTFFDVCLQYEVEYNNWHGNNNNNIAGKKKKKESKKKSWKIRVMKLYETAISFYTSAGDSNEWQNVVNGYRRDLDSFNYGC